ncbi:MAG: ABC transporter permease, partial [Bacteroidales bacterium]|nr:ABC transporter permease [Bacteroidales bacterium]
MNILFFKLALRNILRNKFYSLINIAGFSIGIATVLFLFLFLKLETGFDNFHPDGDRLYRVVETWNSKGNQSVSGFAYYPEAPDIKNSIPGIDAFCRISDIIERKCFSDNRLYKIDKLRFADDNFFDFFGFNLVRGNPATALNSANQIVLSRKMARQIFGDADPMGKVLVFNQKLQTVSGVADDLPMNTHLRFDAVVSTRFLEQDRENFYLGWGGGMQFLSYLKLTPGVKPDQIEARLPDLLYEKINKGGESSGFKLSANLQNIRDVHLSTGPDRYDCPDNRSKNSILIVTVIGLIILLLAMVNYISLYVAQKSSKIKSISLLSIHGAGRSQLISQAYIETLIVTTISALLGVLLLVLFVPSLNNYLSTSVTPSGNCLPLVIFMIVLILILSLMVTLLSATGIFRLKVVNTLKDNVLPGNRNSVLTSVLVTFQFTIVVVLIISGLFINRQNNYLMNSDLGFNKSNILSIIPDEDFKHNELLTFKQELHKLPEISRVSLSSEGVGSGVTMNGYKIKGETDVTMLNVIYTDEEFLNCFGVELTSGRNFKNVLAQDSFSILVNEKLVKRAGWKDPLNQTIVRSDPLTVVGTVKDFNFASLFTDIRPLIIMCNPSYDGWGYACINIRYQTSDISTFMNNLRRLWEKDFPGIPYEISFLDDQLARNYTILLAYQKIVNFFSVLAILIACMGLFGLTSLVSRRRTKEIGIRRVNGAHVSEVMFLLNRDFLKWVLFALIVAIPV